jgi:uncharacterized protein with HEPN domain
MQEDDRIRIRHMIEAGEAVTRFIADRKPADLSSDQLLLFALVRALEIVGEAAARISQETRSRADSIPWKAIVGMRNRLVHAYFDVDVDIVWKAATEEIPELVRRLRALAIVDEGTGEQGP